MIRRLYNIHHRKTIAVIGSGPSATVFDPADSDVSIGVNGAAMLAHTGVRLDYFVCGSQHSPSQPWFSVDCADTRIICVRFALHDRYLYPDTVYPQQRRQSYPDDDIDTIGLPPPVSPHLTYRYTWTPSAAFLAGERPFDKVVIGGTIASVAVQLAYLMGAACIRLYGCSFNRQTSRRPEHYFYQPSTERRGGVDAQQTVAMNQTLSLVRRNGVYVHVVGETALSEYDDMIQA